MDLTVTLTKVPRKPLGSFSSRFGLAASAGTPADIVDRLTEAMQQVSASAAYQAGLKNLGNEPFPLRPAQGAAFIKAEVDKWAAVARSANIQVD
jgi:tripartite-type tricarboxylate transporter receptor subunit TctC